MNKILRNTWLGAIALMSIGFVGCSDDPDPLPAPENPKIVISNVIASATSVSFTLTPSKAVKYTYAVAPKGEAGTETVVSNTEATTQKVEGLLAEKNYTITAVAYAKDGTKSAAVTHDFVTNPKAMMAISAEIAVKITSATLTLIPTNATKFYYAYYPSAKKVLNWKEVMGNEQTIVELTELTPNTEYLLEAYAVNADGEGDIVTSAPFKTYATPTLTITPTTVMAKAAEIKMTPANATGFGYIYYKAAESPSDPQWIKVETTEAKTIELKKLTPNTDYVIEGYAYSAGGDGQMVKVPFHTAEAEALTVNVITTSTSALVHFEMNPAKIAGYYYSNLLDPNDEYNTIKTIEDYLNDVKNNSWINPKHEASEETMMSGAPNKTFNLFVVCCDAAGEVDPTTAQKIDVVFPVSDRTGKGEATVTIGTPTAGSTDVKAELIFSEDAAMFIAGAVKKSDTEGAGSIEAYVNLNLSNYMPMAMSSLANPYAFNSLTPQAEYYIFAVAIDQKGRYGRIVTASTATQKVNFDPAVTTVITPYQISFKSAIFSITTTGASVVRYKNMLTTTFETDFGGKMENALVPLYDEFADQIYPDENGRFEPWGLEYNLAYVLVALPVKDDGTFGTPTMVNYSTTKFAATGTATVTMTKTTVASDHTTYTLTPDANCTQFMYGQMAASEYEEHKNKIGEHLVAGYPTLVNPSMETPVEVYPYGEDYYLIVIAGDKDGKWSTPQVSERVILAQ
ncbi:MAG: fibronectin type III domain-containing protein [Alistipes sp.]